MSDYPPAPQLLHYHGQQHQSQVSLEAALAFIDECGFDTDDSWSCDTTESTTNQAQQPRNCIDGVDAATTAVAFGGTAFGAHGCAGDVGRKSAVGYGPASTQEADGMVSIRGANAALWRLAEHRGGKGNTGVKALASGGNDSTSLDQICAPMATTGSPVIARSSRSMLQDTTAAFRGRRKEELMYLREKVQEFQQQLDQLRKATRRRSRPPSSTVDVAASSSSSASAEHRDQSGEPQDHLPSMWEELATRQREERQKVELENSKLKTALEAQIRMANSLERILRKRANKSARLEHL